jgi:hypothetical protein
MPHGVGNGGLSVRSVGAMAVLARQHGSNRSNAQQVGKAAPAWRHCSWQPGCCYVWPGLACCFQLASMFGMRCGLSGPSNHRTETC